MVEHGVSVVVPVRGRVPQLRRLLDSLTVAVRRCPEPVEVIVVDDSAAADARRHRESCDRADARYLRGPRHVGAKRNLGVRNARYDLVLFIDSDCRASPDLIRRHAATLRAAPPGIGGVTGPSAPVPGRGYLDRVMAGSEVLNGDLSRPARYAQLTWATTCNLAVRRAAFDAAGGFPERSLTVVAGEDVELGVRLSGAGYAIRCDPAAGVEHDPPTSGGVRGLVRRLYTYGRSEQWLCAIHPERRRFVWNPATVLGVAALTAATVPARVRGPVLLGVPLLAGAVLTVRLRRELARDRTGPVTEALTRVVLELSFDVGAAVAAVQLGRPALLLGGLHPVDERDVLRTAPPGVTEEFALVEGQA
ncbi:glycosyltransferase family 2 protein [Catenuloplanes indicus]|nr:glycosyltransferase [Catenuloplanes indicus]